LRAKKKLHGRFSAQNSPQPSSVVLYRAQNIEHPVPERKIGIFCGRGSGKVPLWDIYGTIGQVWRGQKQRNSNQNPRGQNWPIRFFLT
jgi:hypothetical protein